MEQLRADPDRGDRARVAELADNHEIDRAVKRLQEIREHKGSGEFQQSDGQIPFDQIAFFVLFGIHKSTLSLRLRRRGHVRAVDCNTLRGRVKSWDSHLRAGQKNRLDFFKIALFSLRDIRYDTPEVLFWREPFSRRRARFAPIERTQ